MQRAFSSVTDGEGGERSDTAIQGDSFATRISSRAVNVGVIGLGYVGLPLACLAAERGFQVLGFDVDSQKIASLEKGNSYIRHIPGDVVRSLTSRRLLRATDDFSKLSDVDVILICVPTPLTRNREPDLTYVVRTAESVAQYLRRGHLVVLESTTYPGTTRQVVLPVLERTGLKSGVDFFLAYSPEREDPGNEKFTTGNIPKVVGGDGPQALQLARAFYDEIAVSTISVESLETAEAVKLTENIFRSVNIALVNELKVIYDAMGIDIWQVIDAAKSKPFGFMPFYPGPGLGGHCIPVDPFYLTWKAREYEISTRFVELAGEINTAMPRYVVDRVAMALSERFGRAIKGAQILLIGIAYKKNVDDIRESPAFKIIELLERRSATVHYHDPFVPEIPPTREHSALAGRQSVTLSAASIAAYDAVLICTDHDDVDYSAIGGHARLIIDTRNACARVGVLGAHIVKA